jgi:proline iminopeptidase
MIHHRVGFLPRNSHEIAWYTYGNPDGIPVLFFHGGPGAGFNKNRVGALEPLLNEIYFISFDQRGTGNSKPKGSLEQNCTQFILEDAEALRLHLGITKWVVSGTSWGTCLALLYAQTYNEQCLKLVLTSLFLARAKDRDWFFKDVQHFYRDIFEEFTIPSLEGSAEEIRKNWLTLINNSDVKISQHAAYKFSMISSYLGRINPRLPVDITDDEISGLKIMLHYADNNFYLDPQKGAIEQPEILKKIPITLLHGRFDMTSPVSQVFDLKKIFPHIDIRIVNGGHSTSEDVMKAAFLELFKDII